VVEVSVIVFVLVTLHARGHALPVLIIVFDILAFFSAGGDLFIASS